jgi:putative hydrolase of HD superfamily
MKRLVEFFFEVGMLKRTPRSGWQFLGPGGESVADHSYRTTMIAFALAQIDESVDRSRVILMALVHDLAEARTGDLNYMNQKYVVADEVKATRDMVRDLSFGDELQSLLEEYRLQATPEAILVRDADQLEMLLSLKEFKDTGNPSTDDWMPFVERRLRTETARSIARQILASNSSDWWFDRKSDWWIRGGKI